jgi:hypothetical protein
MRIVRTLALAVCLLALSAAPSGAADAIAAGNGSVLSLGSNWGPYETYRGVSFRWVDNDAEIVLSRDAGDARVAIACEGGPSLQRLSFPLRVLDAAHRQVDHVFCDGPGKPALMFLPAGRADARYYLHVDGGGKRVHGESRILNFRVFRLDDGGAGRTAPGGDIVDWRSGVRLGDGWFAVERQNGQYFRWMASSARIFVSGDTRARARATLRMLLEVGPSVGSLQAPLTISDGHGRTLLRTMLSGRGVVLLQVQLERGENEFVIGVSGANKPVPRERRTLSARLFNATVLR